ncbi:hypothetical protein FNV43_RR22939 [Rhamnella rubrinervis]|uniref:Uncharacterized protein n=1 Tax=Rhamnella rubrinervis TaxID=2594499 RepID=A0A8K0E2V2_9ROSA|nr:hypothetical protein FNV43_RR22939 [Rhamnella rubrinervis]
MSRGSILALHGSDHSYPAFPFLSTVRVVDCSVSNRHRLPMAQVMKVTMSMQHMQIKPKRLVAVTPIMEEAVTYLQADPRKLLLETLAKQANFERDWC